MDTAALVAVLTFLAGVIACCFVVAWTVARIIR